MRVGTWNLEKGARRKSAGRSQLNVLADYRLDVVVLTEPSEEALTHWGSTVVTSSETGNGKPWVALVGAGLALRGDPRVLSVAAETEIAGRRVLVYGSVLPWTKATSDIPEVADGRSSDEFFLEELHDQVSEIETFCSEDDLTVVWAGDFNQNLLGPLYGGSARRREELQKRLGGLGFEAWNRLAPHAIDGLFTIDLICGPDHIAVERTETIANTIDGDVVTDHAGYVVELRYP